MSEFTIKDSGERMTFDGGMVRDVQTGKTLYHLVLDGPMFIRWAEHLTKGAAKYSESNWLKAEGPAELARFRASAFRHFIQWYRGDTDEDHASAVFFNINGAEYVKTKLTPDIDAQAAYADAFQRIVGVDPDHVVEDGPRDVQMPEHDLEPWDGVTPIPALETPHPLPSSECLPQGEEDNYGKRYNTSAGGGGAPAHWIIRGKLAWFLTPSGVEQPSEFTPKQILAWDGVFECDAEGQPL